MRVEGNLAPGIFLTYPVQHFLSKLLLKQYIKWHHGLELGKVNILKTMRKFGIGVGKKMT